MLRRLYDWVMRLAGSKHAEAWLATLAFCEGIFFPIPPDVLLMPIVLANRDKAWRYAALTVTASVLGGCVGYSVGFFLHPVGEWILSLTGSADAAAQFEATYRKYGVILLAVPIPYKITAIASGMFSLPLFTFVAASILIRGLRFFLVAGLIRRYGPPIQAFIEQRLALVVSGVALLLIAVVLALKFVH
ncbi:YqaA family protein [Caulobacter sp. KR2-114]|uniref:YqaA family protein n=1 Tax=Caulobacter sp. KR2-114 TaxID=3400912 RepID=UPI003C0955A6